MCHINFPTSLGVYGLVKILIFVGVHVLDRVFVPRAPEKLLKALQRASGGLPEGPPRLLDGYLELYPGGLSPSGEPPWGLRSSPEGFLATPGAYF